jgi:hypothetical protein
MKKVFILVAMIALLAVSNLSSATTLNLDLSGSSMMPTAQETIRIHNVTGTLDGTPVEGKYWVDFQWDPVNLVFVPTAAGAEPQTTGHTWSWTQTYEGDKFQYTITSDPNNRLLYVSYQQVSYSPWICSQETFIQGNNQFGTSTSKYSVDDNTALITYDQAFDGCGDIYAGQTLTATISNLPSWFDFTKTFGVVFPGWYPVYCEPDGTVHK